MSYTSPNLHDQNPLAELICIFIHDMTYYSSY